MSAETEARIARCYRERDEYLRLRDRKRAEGMPEFLIAMGIADWEVEAALLEREAGLPPQPAGDTFGDADPGGVA